MNKIFTNKKNNKIWYQYTIRTIYKTNTQSDYQGDNQINNNHSKISRIVKDEIMVCREKKFLERER